MNLISIIKLSVVLILLSAFMAVAQIGDDFEKWKRREQEKFQEFKDKRDQEFAEFLKKQWLQMQLMQGLVADDKPKPVKIPVYTPPVDAPIKPVPHSGKIVQDIPIPEPTSEVKPDLTNKPVPAPADRINTSALKFTFFDASLTIDYDNALRATLGDEINKEAISRFWEALSRSKYDDLIKQVQYYKKEMRLNDWGYCQLLNKIGEGIYQGSRNENHLFVWFMLSKSGYMAKVGYNSEQVHLLLPSPNTLYGVSYFTFGDQDARFYVVSFDGQSKPSVGSIYTYDGTYPGADGLIDFKVESLPQIREVIETKKLRFSYQEKDYDFTIRFNKNVIDFFEHYPHTNIEVYFGAPLSSEAGFSLLKAMKSVIEGKSETEAVNILLRFVQTAFAYKTDQEQFGREKFLFPEESLFYTYSDCEDRSILFSYLVRELLGLEVIGLDYPGHIATAVKFSDGINDLSGDDLTYQNQRYMICDPTYINADLGMCMPQFKSITPDVIGIKGGLK